VRRLFSTFAHGAPGVGLLLMRVVAGSALSWQGIVALAGAAEPAAFALPVACILAGALLVAGLWTPVAATLVAIGAALHALLVPGDAGFHALLASLAAALALLGPGAWSLDARLFGWRRVEIRNEGRFPGDGRDSPLE
jgi:uncharacterized membrane protein YphA (DoxX/SURF4 family)